MNDHEEYLKWRDNPVFDEHTRAEVAALKDEAEIKDRFYRSLSFGTGGMRGIIGAGTNRMNVYTVGKATQGLADFICSRTNCGSVVIAYDSRHMSREFALDTALILAANGIKAYFFKSLRPTPELSFSVRYLKATAGIVITASHNPPSYNGYKVYWSDGGQIVSPYDELIIGCVNGVEDYAKIKRITLEEAQERGLLKEIGEEIDVAYLNEIKKLSLSPEELKKFAKDIKIVYTPLNGAGNMPVRRILSELGFQQVFVVPEQEAPDGDFPTLEFPNPEEPKAFEYALRMAHKVSADLILATDPDSDRLGVYAKDGMGGYIPFTGNMSGSFLLDYLLSRRAEKGLLPQRRAEGALVTTIVSTKLAHAIADAYSISTIEVLTGFKYIGEQIGRFEKAREENGGKTNCEKGAYQYEFGFEESYGCLPGTYARDKDAVAAAAVICEAAAYYRSQGISLWDRMKQIYQTYGFYEEALVSFTLTGSEGAEKINEIMRRLKLQSPERLGGISVTAIRDYETGIRLELKSGKTEKLSLPKSSVLYFELGEEGWCCARPSGTEPKIKFYFGVKGTSEEEAKLKIEKIKSDLIGLTE